MKNIFFVIIFLCTLLTLSSEEKVVSSYIFNASETAIRNKSKPTETMEAQIAGFDALFAEIRKIAPNVQLYIVINGGTSSQRWWGPTLLAGDTARLWKPLQEKYGVRYLWRMNFNQQNEDEAALLAQIEKHIQVYMIIFAAEPYLLKYLKSGANNTWKDEVGILQRGITGKSYAARARECIPMFGKDRKFALMIAPGKQGSDTAFGQRVQEWNGSVIPALQKLKEEEVDIHACLHVYRRELFWDVPAFITEIQNSLTNIPLLITESGASSDGDSDGVLMESKELAQKEAALFRDIQSVLRPIDINGSHSGWKPEQGNLSAGWHNGKTLTLKGMAMMDAVFK